MQLRIAGIMLGLTLAATAQTVEPTLSASTQIAIEAANEKFAQANSMAAAIDQDVRREKPGYHLQMVSGRLAVVKDAEPKEAAPPVAREPEHTKDRVK